MYITTATPRNVKSAMRFGDLAQQFAASHPIAPSSNSATKKGIVIKAANKKIIAPEARCCRSSLLTDCIMLS